MSKQAQTGEHFIERCAHTHGKAHTQRLLTEGPRSVYAMHRCHTKKQWILHQCWFQNN